jgi:hypothetical protein
MKSSFSHEKNLCETPSYSILCGEIIREFVANPKSPKGIIQFLCGDFKLYLKLHPHNSTSWLKIS